MTGDTHLASKHAPLAHLGAAGYAHLSRHHGVTADLIVVGYLHQVVQLDTGVHYSSSHNGSIHAGIGSYLHIVLDDGHTYLRYLVVPSLCGLEAEAVCTYHTTCMQDAAAAYLAVVIDHCIAVDFRIVAHLHILAQANMGVKHAALTYLHTFGNRDKGTDVAVLAHLGSRVNECHVTDARALGLHALIRLQQLCHRLASVRNPDESSAHLLLGFEVIVDEHHAALCLVDVMLILVIGKEADTTRLSFLDLGKVVDLRIRITLNGSPNESGYHLCTKFHIYPILEPSEPAPHAPSRLPPGQSALLRRHR